MEKILYPPHGQSNLIIMRGFLAEEGEVALGRALFATWIPKVGQIICGGCTREGTFCEGVVLGRPLFVPWGPQEGQILWGGCPR